MPILNDDNLAKEGIQIGVDAAAIGILRLQGGGQQFSCRVYLKFRAERGTTDNLRLKYEGAGDIQPQIIGYTALELDIRYFMEKVAAITNNGMTLQGVDIYNTNGASSANQFVGTVIYSIGGALSNSQNTASSTVTLTFKDSANNDYRLRVVGTGLDDSTTVSRYPTLNTNINNLFKVFIDNNRFVSRFGEPLTTGLNATYGQSRDIKKILGEKR